MKRLIIKPLKNTAPTLMAVIALILGGCLKKIDNHFDETNVTDVSFWKTEEHLKAAANYFYNSLPEIDENNNSAWSDDGRDGNGDAISDGSRQVPRSSGDWNGAYKLIRATNNLLEKASTMDIDTAAKVWYMAEARFFRAYAYSQLVRRFGDVPLILRTLEIGDELLLAPRTDRQEVLDAVYADLDFAAANLPAAADLATEDYGRVTQGAALALKVRAALFEGTFNKYHGIGDSQKHLTLARTAAETLIDEGYHRLYEYAPAPDSSYYYLFQEVANGPGNHETILPRLYGENMENQISVHDYSGGLARGTITPTRSLADAYLFVDGLPYTGPNRSPLYEEPVNTMSEFADRDPRMGMTFFKTGDPSINYGTYRPHFQFTQTGYHTFKYFNQAEWASKRSFTHHKVLRYAEVLLSYAEAVYELDGAISDETLDKSVNLVRTRAGMPPLTNAFVLENGQDMLEEIRRERRVEFALEIGQRYWDIIRWKIAETVLPHAQLGIQYFAEEYALPLDNPNLTEEGYIIAQDATSRTFDPARDYLWPIPIDQLGLNPNLEQNPGWQ